MSKEIVSEQHSIIGVSESKREFVRTTHPDAQWFQNAGLGLFLHWGISSVFGNTDLSWGMMEKWVWDAPLPGYKKVTPREYYTDGMAGFKAENYDPEKWIKAAKDAGFRYAVLTTKHHDGYTLWPSEYTEIGVKQSLGGRDLVGPFIEACRKYGLKVGLYYSPPDWWFDRSYMSFYGGPEKENRPLKNFDLQPIDKIPERPEEHMKALSAHIRGQVKELLTRWGKIDIIWFDGRGVRESDPDPITVEEIRALQPGILINPRMHGVGDFVTPECRIPETAPEGWWECCHLLNDNGWGYTVHPYKSFEWFLDTFTEIRKKGGNFLANVGPMCTGEMPAEYYERMSQIGEWMKAHHAEVDM